MAQLELEIRRPLGEALSLLVNPPRQSFQLALVPPLALVPGVVPTPSTQPRIVRVQPGQLAVGLILFLGSRFLTTDTLTAVAMATLTGVLRAIDVATKSVRDQKEICRNCIEKGLWSQAKPQTHEKNPTTTRNPNNQRPRRPVGRPRKTSVPKVPISPTPGTPTPVLEDDDSDQSGE